MSDNHDDLYILAQNLEGTAHSIAKVRQYLLDHQMFDQWIELVQATSVLNCAIERVAEILKSQQQSIVGDKGA